MPPEHRRVATKIDRHIADHADHLRPMLEKGAHVYVCGNKAHLEEAGDGAGG